MNWHVPEREDVAQRPLSASSRLAARVNDSDNRNIRVDDVSAVPSGTLARVNRSQNLAGMDAD